MNILKKLPQFLLLSVFLLGIFAPSLTFADMAFLTPEENLWLKSRNNTLVVYPEKNFPPYSYQNSSGLPQGLSIDYIELIAQKIGAKIQYLPARSRVQIIDDVRENKKGDIITSINDTQEREEFLYFTDTYITVPAVIVVRKDLDTGHTLTLSDLTGKKVAVGSKHAVENFIRTNNPRVIVESVVDDESGLQQVLLGEVDAVVMDIASLSYYLSKQVLNSVKVVGNTGFEYKLSFAVPKDKEILQSIIDKGLQQISTNDRKILTEKWVTYPSEITNSSSSLITSIADHLPLTISIACLIVLLLILFIKRKHGYVFSRSHHKAHVVTELEEEMSELEDASKGLMQELNEVHALEQDIKEKLKSIDK